ncbi:uncharacterized protein HMPREF1541_00371 [Cyphellophora europaea CBS 101466]|uniref:Methyltransferase domain-containing protein n=1 Tax=Cyphellophora europaea (strain CBS 101466) TaxID=1220924 RepID=W2SBV3_CYPE1|nr:uncharacterized protein HMPREF1541_00371 [Cyphellophora europaea CBS 101466]ETN46187.1 hypothetical protein HMPREF1541_00371 [Cyphellophora europaea CBS 101466]
MSYDDSELIEVDSFPDEGFAESITEYATSIASDIRRGIEENGRTYPAFGRNEYGLPIDEQEQDRNDLQHCKFGLILGDRLHLAPIAEEPANILDLGTGSGIWAIDMADKHPTANVIGVDVAAVQPRWVPPNCSFEIDDVESDWLFRPDTFDFIHGREFLLAIRDWDRLISQSFHHLKPGGYLELSSSFPEPGSDDDTIPANSAWVQFTETFFEIGEKIGASGHAPKRWKAKLEAHGFEDVQEFIFKIPSSPWPRDRRLKHIGALEVANLDKGAEALLIRGMTGVLGRPKEEATVCVMIDYNAPN